ncbi:MAG TPA: methyltransferase dimerization domain-containing protein [Edaphobacter sp.]|nr:methyltransferase dimerization domain-containing protein [Edaphobacter sp.]
MWHLTNKFYRYSGVLAAHALGVATKLGVPEFLAEGPLHVDELASRTETNVLALFRLLRALESVGIFIQTSPRVFGNTPASECLRKDAPGSQLPLVLQNLSRGNGAFEGWDELEYSVRTGEPSVDKIYGYDYWSFFDATRKPMRPITGRCGRPVWL